MTTTKKSAEELQAEEQLAAWTPPPYRVFEVVRERHSQFGETRSEHVTVFAHGIRIHERQPVIEFVDAVKINGLPVYQTKRIIHGFIDVNEVDPPKQPITPQ